MLQVLKTDLDKRKEALAALIHKMNPSNNIVKKLTTERFLNNDLVAWEKKEPVLQHISEHGKAGHMWCTVCDIEFAPWSQERCVLHLLGSKHNENCKKKLQLPVTAVSQEMLKELSASVLNGEKIVSRIKNYASQHCVAKSLPFTAASMALECVCAAISTIAPAGISAQSIATLEKCGHKQEVNNLFFAFASVTTIIYPPCA